MYKHKMYQMYKHHNLSCDFRRAPLLSRGAPEPGLYTTSATTGKNKEMRRENKKNKSKEEGELSASFSIFLLKLWDI